MKTKDKYFLRILLVILLLFWMAVIFMFSAKPAEESQEQSYFIGRGIADFVQRFSGGSWTQEQKQMFAESIDFYVRKTAHGTEYAILGVLWMGVLASFGKALPVSGRIAWICGTIYAVLDEVHQYFVPGRACQVRDMLIDSTGVLTGVLFFLGCAKLWAVWNAKGLKRK